MHTVGALDDVGQDRIVDEVQRRSAGTSGHGPLADPAVVTAVGDALRLNGCTLGNGCETRPKSKPVSRSTAGQAFGACREGARRV